MDPSRDIEGFMKCNDDLRNGSLMNLDCLNVSSRKLIDTNKCRSIFEQVHVYGLTMLVFADIVFAITHAMAIILYIFIPRLCRRAYDKAVLSFIVTQFLQSLNLIVLGHYLLCNKQLNDLSYILFGLGMMTFTICGCLWLLIISMELSSTITSLRLTSLSKGAKGHQDENQKFLIYLIWVILGTLIPVSTAIILQFSLPENHIANPNFHKMTEVNYRVIVHAVIVPAFVAVSSNVLFIYTTLKMMSIKKLSKMAHENRKGGLKDKYILYLKLYLLMDAPYVTGVLGSTFENLWFLKFVRVFQPVLMLYAVLPRDMITKMTPWKNKLKNNNRVLTYS
ncbi:hypothetical protein QAD02_006843 [Eretmocerus hayati]|uniref:Uncharacterized protein n=1 Tax=Eretmocerus hayati TaxID=131215 RepID=A0ACC2N2C6_9HYME|nr:hypothetical protein QAD02_006843 [Eretmocerus hayati]